MATTGAGPAGGGARPALALAARLVVAALVLVVIVGQDADLAREVARVAG
ncbi:MAG TPA: hypothetical protein VK904_08645 [Miltoncostaeaceae bacterium]|nr:hypothetical protein [Miltoncostaeaceae bacterium]